MIVSRSPCCIYSRKFLKASSHPSGIVVFISTENEEEKKEEGKEKEDENEEKREEEEQKKGERTYVTGIKRNDFLSFSVCTCFLYKRKESERRKIYRRLEEGRKK